MTISSTAFQDGEPIPREYSRRGDNHNPPLTFSEVPTEAKSLVLIVEDPDAPNGTFTHWIVYDMSPATLQIPENGLPPTGRQATNDFGRQAYDGPQPPSGVHHYQFKLFALDQTLDNVRASDKRQQVLLALKSHMIDQAQITGRYTAEV